MAPLVQSLPKMEGIEEVLGNSATIPNVCLCQKYDESKGFVNSFLVSPPVRERERKEGKICILHQFRRPLCSFSRSSARRGHGPTSTSPCIQVGHTHMLKGRKASGKKRKCRRLRRAKIYCPYAKLETERTEKAF